MIGGVAAPMGEPPLDTVYMHSFQWWASEMGTNQVPESGYIFSDSDLNFREKPFPVCMVWCM